MASPPTMSPENQDTISITTLSLPHGVLAPDVWGKPKEQPATLTLTLDLRTGFSSAASSDELDASTIHYGELAKKIRSASQPNQTAGQLSAAAEEAIIGMGRKAEGKFIVGRSVVEVNMPKASMYGNGVGLIGISGFDELGRRRETERVFVVREVKLMLLVGVNGYERRGKQPVVVSLWVWLGQEEGGAGSEEGVVALFNIEQTLVQIMQDTSFATLEALADYTVKALQKRMLNQLLPGSQVQLRLEKPRAIAFADAPVIEIFRTTPGGRQKPRQMHQRHGMMNTLVSVNGDVSRSGSVAHAGTSGKETLSIIKPYS